MLDHPQQNKEIRYWRFHEIQKTLPRDDKVQQSQQEAVNADPEFGLNHEFPHQEHNQHDEIEARVRKAPKAFHQQIINIHSRSHRSI